MIELPPLLTINKEMRRPSAEQVAAFRGVPTGFVADSLGGGGALSGAIRPLGEGRDIRCVAAGPALTADCGPADVLAIHAVLKFVKPGDMVVSACDGHQACATVGDRVAGMLRNCGAAGLVTDGPARDYDGMVEVGLPVWCTGLTPASPFMSGPGSVGFAIQIGGQQVETGDMIVADRDGVVVVPFARIDEVIGKLERIKTLEAERDAAVAGGMKLPPDIEAMLEGDQVRYT